MAQRRNTAKKILLDILIILFAVAAITCGSVSYIHFDKLQKNDEEFKKLSRKSYTALKKQNSDMIGWLKMPKTKINYPVMYTPDNPEYYLHANFDRQYSLSGTLFVAGDTDISISHNILIYGHHMMDGTMFGNLEKYVQEGKRKMRFDILKTDDGSVYEHGTYQVIAAFKTSTRYSNPYYLYNEIDDQETFDKYKQILMDNTELDIPVECDYPDKLITLSTCSYHLWYRGQLDRSGRYIVVAKKIFDETIGQE